MENTQDSKPSTNQTAKLESVMPEKVWPLEPHQKAMLEALRNPNIKRISFFVGRIRPVREKQ